MMNFLVRTRQRAAFLGSPWLLNLLLVLLLAACAPVPPRVRPAPDYAAAPHAEGPFVALEQELQAEYGADASGFKLLERNEEGLRWRLALIDSARHSLDLQYYVWFGDTVGLLLMDRVLAAAERGVKVRLLFDDLNTLLHDMESIELRDATMARIDGHRNIEIRLFNAWQNRAFLGRVVEFSADFSRLNRRMHNKQMVADNRVAIIGGRNIGDEYFGLNPAFNFHDLDVLGIGPVARQASAVFDRYWNSEWVQRVPLVESAAARASAASDASATRLLAAKPSLQRVPVSPQQWDRELGQLSSRLHPGKSQVHTDSPSRAESTRNHMPEAFRALMRSARCEVLIANAYIIPDEAFMTDLRELGERGVRIRILTNSLSSHDVPAVNSHYKRWRASILQTGAELHELRSDAAVRSELVDLPPTQSSFVGLHAKAMVIDRERAFIGSMNLDPRSELINSEMGIIIDSPPLAADLARRIDKDMNDSNSWRVEFDSDGALQWRSSLGTLSSQPSRSVWQRLQDVLFMFFPGDLY